MRGADHPVQPASTAKASGPKVTSSVVSVPKAAKSASEGVAASGRDVAPVPVASSPAKPPAKARPKAPESSACADPSFRRLNLPPPPTSPPPDVPSSSLNVLLVPNHHHCHRLVIHHHKFHHHLGGPPPSAEELAACEPQQPVVRETGPEDPNGPVPEGEWEWVEEEEEEEPREEDVVVEVEQEVP